MEATFSIDPGQLTGAASALAGVIVGQLSAWLLEVNRRRYERKQTAAAVKAEIEAIYLLVSVRRYEHVFAASIEHMAKTREVRIPKIPIREEVLPVYKANVSKLGLLPSPLPANLALLFTLATGIREDFKTLCESEEKVDVDDMMRFQGGVLLILRCTMWLMEETTLRLRKFLGERFKLGPQAQA